METFTKDSLSP